MAKFKRKRVADEALPEDPLAAGDWIYRATIEQSRDVLNDRGLKGRERRELFLRFAMAAAQLQPKSALYRAEQAVRGEARDISSASGKGPELEDATQFVRASGAAASRRGRPRKRSTL